MPAGDRQPVEVLLGGVNALKAEAVRVAAEHGHDVEYDGVTLDRWTCRRCQRFVMLVSTNIYGPAVRQDCDDELSGNYLWPEAEGPHDSDCACGDPGWNQS